MRAPKSRASCRTIALDQTGTRRLADQAARREFLQLNSLKYNESWVTRGRRAITRDTRA